MNRADRFTSRSLLPAHGDIRVRNTSDTPHFLSLLRVKPGTTDAEVQALFGGSSLSSPLMRGPGTESSMDLVYVQLPERAEAGAGVIRAETLSKIVFRFVRKPLEPLLHQRPDGVKLRPGDAVEESKLAFRPFAVAGIGPGYVVE
jgi:hypothetical protein